jgi:anti-sigma B factor antagonist
LGNRLFVAERPGVQEHEFRLAVVRADGDVPLVSVDGDVDLYSAPELRERLFELSEEDVSRIVLDLSRATFLDSMALGVLLGAKKRLVATGGDLELVVATPDVRRIFEITMLNRIFVVHESREEALRSGGTQASSASSSEK